MITILIILCALLGFSSGRVSGQETSDAAHPVLKSIEPAAGAVLGVAEITVSGAYDGNPVSVSCNNRDGIVFGSKFVVEHVPLTEGPNHLMVKATDAAGKISEAALDLVCDLTPPRVKLVEPKAGAVLGVFRTRVSGTVTDATAVTMRVNGMPVSVQAGRFDVEVPLLEGSNAIRVEAIDAAGHVSDASTDVTVDAIAPRIVVSQPASGSVTRQNVLTVGGRVEDATAASLTANGKSISLDSEGRFSFTHSLVSQGKNTITLVARDKAGHTSHLPLEVTLDTRPPVPAGIDPAPGSAAVALTSPVVLRFSEAVAGGTVVVSLGDGRVLPGTQRVQGDRLIFTFGSPIPDGAQVLARATGVTDLAGNVLTTPVESRFTTIDKTPPRELVLDPIPATTPRSTVTVSGRTEPNAQVRVGSRRTTADETGRFSASVRLVPGERNRFKVQAADAAGNVTSVTQAETNSQWGPLDVSAIDFANNLLTITFTREVDPATVNAQSISIRTSSGPVAGQYATTGAQVTFTPVPDLSSMPFLLEISTLVTDTGANPMGYPYARMFNRPAGGMVVVGEVYDESTGLPLYAITVKAATIDGAPASSPVSATQTGSDGRFAIDINGSTCTLLFETDGYTSASRAVRSLSQLAETVLDVRLTPRLPGGDARITPEGGSYAVSAGRVHVTAPANSVPVDRKINVAQLTGQGLPDRLPIGWSPLFALDIGPAGMTFGQPIQITAESAQSFQGAFVRWDEATRHWNVLAIATGLTATITQTGQYAWVVADTVPVVPPAPQAGHALEGLPDSTVPEDVTGQLSFGPNQVFPGGTSSAKLLFSTQRLVSSGALIQAKISEQYEMLTGAPVTYPLYVADLIAYNYGGEQSSVDFSISPNRNVTMENLREGWVDAKMVLYSPEAGGSIVGPAGGLVAGDGGAEVQIPAGALASATVVTVKALAEALLPAGIPQGFRFLGALEVSFGGAVLSQPASISVTGTTVTPGAMLVASRLDGTSAILTDSVALSDNRLRAPGTTPTGFTFTGAREGGVYLFLEATQAMGYATGVVFDQSVAVPSARVSAEGQGIFAISAANGRYDEIAPAGTARLLARHPTTLDEGTAEGALTADSLINLDINLHATGPSVVGQTPATGATNVPLATRVQIIFSEAVSASTLTADSFYVTESATRVTGSVSLSADGLLAEFRPAQDLPSSKTFTVTLKNTIQDLRANAMSADYTSTFTTRDVIPPTYDLTKIRVVLPTNGMIRVIGEPGAIEPGATIWLFNERSGASVSTQGLSDGSFDISIPAIEGDRVRIRVIDLASNEIEVTPDVYTTPDGRGVQLDSGAHSYITPDGFGIRTEAGSLAEPIIARLDPIADPDQLVPSPDYLARLSAFRLDLQGESSYKELKLSIPAPANLPADAQLFLAREVTVFGERKLMVMDPCAVRDGRIENQSEGWPGPSAEGIYQVMVNNATQLAYISGLAPGIAGVVAALDLVYLLEPLDEGRFILPVPTSHLVQLTIRDTYTGSLIFAGSVDTPTGANQTYFFTESLSKDRRRAQLTQASPLSIATIQWFGVKAVSGQIELTPGGTGTVRIAGTGLPALGRAYIYRYTIDALTGAEVVEQSQTEANDTGAFETTLSVSVGDRFLVAAEKGGIDVDPVFVLDAAEALASGSTAEIHDAAGSGAPIPCVVDLSASRTHLTIKSTQRILEDHRYELWITRLADVAGNSYSSPLLLPFRTRKSTTIEVEPVGRIDSLVLYGRYIFAASGDSGVQVLDAADPGDLQVVGNWTGVGEVRAVALYFDAVNKPWLVLVGGGARYDGYIKILDITDPRTPTQVKSQVISYPIGAESPGYPNMPLDQGKPQRLRVAGRYAFVAIHGAGMMIVDLEQMSASTDLYRECLVGWYPEEWISELEVIKDGGTTRVLLLVDYLGLKMLNVTNTGAITLEGVFLGESRAEAGGKHFNGLALALGYEADPDGDGRLGDDERDDDDADQPAAKQDLAFITIPANQEILTIDITIRTGVPPQRDLPQRILSDGTKLPAEKSTGDLPMIGNIKLAGATGLGQIAFSAKDRMLYVLDATLGVIRISMNQPAGFTTPGQTDPRVLGTIPTAGRPRFGLILDDKLNMAYAGDLDTGLVPVKLGLPRLRIGLKNATGEFVEYSSLLPEALPSEQYVASSYPATPAERQIYLLVHLPMKAATGVVRAGMRSLFLGSDPAPLWISEPGRVGVAIDPSKLTLHLQNETARPEDEAYGLFVSDPIRLTADPKEPDDSSLLSGDQLELSLDTTVGLIFKRNAAGAAYLTEEDARALTKRVPVHRSEEFDSPTPEPAQNPSVGLMASIPGLAGDGQSGVYLHSGELFLEETDMLVPGRGGARALDFALVRRYESQSIYSGPLGWGWDFNYHRRLQSLPNRDVVYFDGLGRRDVFKMRYGADGPLYDAPTGVFADLARHADGTWTLVFRGLYSEHFDIYGRLVRMQDRNDNAIEFFYDSAGRLTVVMDTMGRLYTFDYYLYDGTAPGGRLKSVTDFTGRSVVYSYDERGDLRSATLSQRVRAYTYQADDTNLAFAHNLLTVTDPESHVVLDAITYAQDKVTSERIGGIPVQVTSGDTATTTDGKGHVRTYAHQDGHATQVTIGSLTTKYAYTPDGLVALITYPMLNSVGYVYDTTNALRRSQANVIDVVQYPDTVRGGGDLTSHYEYYKHTDQLKTYTDPRRHPTSYVQDDRGNIRTITYADGTATSIAPDAFGRPHIVTDPENKVTRYEYFSETVPGGGGATTSARPLDPSGGGYLQSVTVDAGGDNIKQTFDYHDRGSLKHQTDATGGGANVTMIDEYDQPRSVIFGSGEAQYTASLEYYLTGRLRTRSERGLTETFTYTPMNQPATATRIGEGVSESASFQYDADFKLETKSDFHGVAERLVYNDLDRLIEQHRAGIRKQSLEYDNNGNVTKLKDGENHESTFAYDGHNRRKTATDPLTHSVSYTLDENGNATQITAPEGYAATAVFDNVDQLKSATQPGSVTQQFGYDRAGNPNSYTTPNSKTWSYPATGSGQVASVTDPLGNKVEYGYDQRGLPSSANETESGGRMLTHTSQFDALGQLRGVNDDLNRNWRAPVLGANARPEVTLDPEGGVTGVNYDALGRVTKSWRQVGGQEQATRYHFHAADRVDWIEDAQGNKTRYFFDAQDRLERIEYADSTAQTYIYDNNDRAVEIHQATGTKVVNTFDPAGRLTDRTITPAANVSGSTSEHFEYDDLNRIRLAQNDNTKVRFEYDPAGRLWKETQILQLQGGAEKTNVVTYGRDLNGNVTSIAYPSGKQLTITPDALDRIASIEQGSTTIAGYTYEGADKVIAKSMGPVSMSAHFDNGKRPDSIIYKGSNDKTLFGRTNTWDQRDLKATEQKSEEPAPTSYTYDEAWRLKQTEGTTFTLDATDSIKQIDETDAGFTSTTAITTNNRHQITASDGVTFGYDPNGNLTTTTYPDGRVVRYVYDWRNQLVRADDGRGGVVDFAYDALNRRVEKKVTTNAGTPVISRYALDGWQVLEEKDDADRVLSRYTYGNGIDEPVEIEKRDPDTGTLKRFIPMQDTNGSVLGLADANGNLIERVQYTPYGKPTFIYDHEPPKVDQVRLVDGTLRIRFSEPVDPATAETAIKVKQGADVLSGSLALTENDRLAIFTPTSAFPQAALTAQITTALKDETGNALAEDFARDFTPTGVNLVIYDRGPPKVQSIKLIAGAIRIQFDEEIDPATIANSVDLLDEQSATIATTVAANGEKGIDVSPTTALTPGTRYTLKVKTTVTDLSTKPLGDVFEQAFVFENRDKLLYHLPSESEHEASSVANTTTFQARDYDRETRLYHFRNRYFSPELGRFLQPDPMGYADSTNLYQGFDNNPANFEDPLGLASGPEQKAKPKVLNRFFDWASDNLSRAGARIIKPFRPYLEKFEIFGSQAGEVAKRELGPDAWRSQATWTEDDVAKQNIGVPYRDSAERGAVEMGSITGTAGQIIVTSAIEFAVWEIGGRLWRVAVQRGQIIARLEDLGPASGKGAVPTSADRPFVHSAAGLSEESIYANGLRTRVPDRSIMTHGPLIVSDKEGGLVIGRGRDLARPGALLPGEYKLSWDPTATTKSEWKINAGLMRKEMARGMPIRDASPGDTGGMYLNAERNLLRDRGWTFDPQSSYWYPPKKQ
ncbi:MAG: Ig-like domain-containing protein [Acidobacteria bacterium]|nr:Ig-like domain-containing protein [Acidobacteriota bacterium]